MISDISVRQMPGFRKAYKKLHRNIKKEVDKAIRAIISDPLLGQEKKGDLAGIWVYKFKVSQHLYLLAYEWDPKSRLLVMLGAHENFYRDLKQKK